jgi:type IV secretion system protein VirB3
MMARAVDTLFVACTRPAMKWGVPFEGFIMNAVVTSVVTVFIIHQPPGFLLAVVVHLALRELSRTDPHFFHRWRLWLKTKAKSATAAAWGGSKLQPTFTRTRAWNGRTSV